MCLLFTILSCQFIISQNQKLNKLKARQTQIGTDTTQVSRKSTSNKNIKNKEATIDLYKIISFHRDTTFVDTTLSLKKDYKFNYLRKDNFNLISFSNLGQTYNTLSEDFQNTHTLPLFGARARHFNYIEIEDVNYYNVPTPFTELFYKSAFEQGQVLDAFFTVNTSKQFNFSIAYKGLRSLGKYQHILTSTGNFSFTSNYKTKNERYQLRAHIVTQDLLNQENGGLKDSDIANFETGDPEFLDRSVFDPNFQNAENILKGKRFYLDQRYNLIQAKDSINTNIIALGNTISFEDKYFQFTQSTENSFFGTAFRSNNIKDKVSLENFYNRFYLNYQNNLLGEINFNVDYNNYNYGYDSVVILNDETIINRIKGNTVAIGGSYKKKFNEFELYGDFGVNVSGDFEGNFLNASGLYNINEDLLLKASFNSSSKAPNFNHLLFQSDYINYNWDNINSFKNISTQQIAFQLHSNRIANISLDYTTINNHTFFSWQNTISSVKPMQYDGVVDYLRVKLNKEIKYRNFTLDNTIMYQKVTNGEEVLNVPEVISRNTLYYANHFFKKALYLQTGITLNYFTKYNMNGYDPLLAEFYTQNETKLGSFPRLDFFINAKIRQTRIYLKAEHFNSAFTGYKYYSAPNYPYRDFTVRFGIVWNFFL